MSPLPPAPTPSNPPPSLTSDPPTTPPASKSPHPTFPAPKLRLELRDLSHSSTEVFLKYIKPTSDFAHLVDTVLRLLYTIPSSSTSQTTSTTDDSSASTTPTKDPSTTARPAPSTPKIPQTRSVTLILRDLDGVAYTTGLDLDDDHKEIHLSLSYIAHVAKPKPNPSVTHNAAAATATATIMPNLNQTNQTTQSSQPDQINPTRHELLGVLCHELVHCFQYNAQGTAPGGLIEGIADWVRLNARYVPPHWKRNVDGKWDRGYQDTGYFLDWIERTKGRGSVMRLNQGLAGRRYVEDVFWKEMFGEGVDVLFGRYKEAVEKEKKDGAGYGDKALKMAVRVKGSDIS